MNADTRKGVECKLDVALQTKGRGWKAYVAVIIPKRPERHIRQLRHKRPVFEIDGASFYQGVTGESVALRKLLSVTVSILNVNDHAIPDDVVEYCWEALDRCMAPLDASRVVEL